MDTSILGKAKVGTSELGAEKLAFTENDGPEAVVSGSYPVLAQPAPTERLPTQEKTSLTIHRLKAVKDSWGVCRGERSEWMFPARGRWQNHLPEEVNACEKEKKIHRKAELEKAVPLNAATLSVMEFERIMNILRTEKSLLLLLFT